MNVIVADAGPIIALAKLDRLDLFRRLFETVLVPDVVLDECLCDHANPETRTIEAAVKDGILTPQPTDDMPKLSEAGWLDDGEAAAIALAITRGCPVLIDEKRGRTFAKRSGLQVIGTCGLLVQAKRSGAIQAVMPLLDGLDKAGYFLSREIRQETLRLCGE